MIVGEFNHIAPLQCNVYERGPADGLPTSAGANHLFFTPWIDCWRMHVEDIIVPQTGAKVAADDFTNLAFPGTSLLRNIGLYFLDVFIFHTNASNDPLNFFIFGQEPGSLESASIGGVRLYLDPVATGVAFQKRYVIYPRLFYLEVVYSALANATDFKMSAVLRAI